MINNSILCADAQVNYNLDIRVKHEHDRKRKMLEHENIIEQYGRSLLSKCAGYTQYFSSDVYTNSTRTKKVQVETVQYGRSMIEMLGVLAIVGVLSVGGIAGYSKAMEKFKINKTIDQVSHIVTNIRTLYAQQTSYEGLNSETAHAMGVVPSELGSNGPGFYRFFTNAFKGGAFIDNSHDVYSYSPLSNSYFGVGFNGLTKEACITLATYDWGDKSSSGLIGYVVAGYDTISMPVMGLRGGTTNKGCYSIGSEVRCFGQAMPVTLATQGCNCTNNDCAIYWLYQ